MCVCVCILKGTGVIEHLRTLRTWDPQIGFNLASIVTQVFFIRNPFCPPTFEL